MSELGYRIVIKDGKPMVLSPNGYRVKPKREYRGLGQAQRNKDAMRDIQDQMGGTGKKIRMDGKRVSIRESWDD